MKRKPNLWLPLLAAISIAATAKSQVPAWQESNHWTLYNTRGAKWYRINPDSLAQYNSRPLSDDSMRIYLSHASLLPSDKPPVWMGAYVTTCFLSNQKRKIDISSYGGFLFDEMEKKYYTIPEEMQKDWLNYLAQSAGGIPMQKQ